MMSPFLISMMIKRDIANTQFPLEGICLTTAFFFDSLVQ